jgi:hypothetical protein
MPLFEQGTDGHLEDAREASERDHRGLALGALELDEVESTAADLGGQRILGEACGGAVACSWRANRPSTSARSASPSRRGRARVTTAAGRIVVPIPGEGSSRPWPLPRGKRVRVACCTALIVACRPAYHPGYAGLKGDPRAMGSGA